MGVTQENGHGPAPTEPAPGPEGRAGAASRSARAAESTTLPEPSLEHWEGRPEEDRIRLVTEVQDSYKIILDELFDSAEYCQQRFESLTRLHVRWRRIIIVGTGFVAILNALAALAAGRPHDETWLQPLIVGLPALAAVAAASLAILANLENFGNHLERGQSYRDASELFLDGGREFEQLWRTHVRTFYPGGMSCVNAFELYRRIGARDSELRRQVKEMTQARTQRGAG